MAEPWPDTLRASDVAFVLENVSRGGGPGLGGFEQVVISGASRWRATISIPIRKNAEILAARTLFALLDGRVGTVAVPAFDGRRANWPVDVYGRRLDPGFTRRKRLDGTIYADPRIPPESAIVAVADVAAAAGTTSLAIAISQGSAPQAGQYVGIAGRLYVLRALTAQAGSVWTFTIRPALRFAVADSEPIEMAIPTCEMRFAGDDQANMTLTSLQHADLSLEFVEAPVPVP
jgi:hypothetical protein